MDQPSRAEDVGELVQGIANDAVHLIEQQFELFKQEMREEAAKAGTAVAAGAVGGGLLALGGILGTHMLVHLLHRSTRLPLWGCYGLVAGAAGAAGIGLLDQARRRAGAVRLDAPATTATLRENVRWLRAQTTGGPT